MTYELCQRRRPDLICVERPNDELYPSKSTGHNGLQSYVDETETLVVEIDTKPSRKSHGKVSEQIGDITIRYHADAKEVTLKKEKTGE